MAVTDQQSPTRKSPSRTMSFDKKMRGFLSRSLSGSFKSSSRRDEEDDTCCNILASDKVSKDEVLEELTYVKNTLQIVKLNIQDFVTSGHYSLLPVLKALLTSTASGDGTGRSWHSVRLVDTIAAKDFSWWCGLQQMILRDYNNNDNDNDNFSAILSVEAQIVIPRATTAHAILTLINAILQHDKDVVQVHFRGAALESLEPEQIPTELDHLLEGNKVVLKKEIIIHVITCATGIQHDDDDEWKEICYMCQAVLEEKAGTNSTADTDSSDGKRPALRRNKSAPSRPRPMTNTTSSATATTARDAPARMPSRRLQRSRHNDNNDDGSPSTSPKPRRTPRRSTEELLQDGSNASLNDDDDNSHQQVMDTSNSRRLQMPSRRGKLSREAPTRAKSISVVPSRTSNAAERLAMLGASSGSKKMASRSIPRRGASGRAAPGRTTSGRVLPERSASGRVAPGRTTSGRVLPERTTSGRVLPARSNSRRVSADDQEDHGDYDYEEENEEGGGRPSAPSRTTSSRMRRTLPARTSSSTRSPPARTTSSSRRALPQRTSSSRVNARAPSRRAYDSDEDENEQQGENPDYDWTSKSYRDEGEEEED